MLRGLLEGVFWGVVVSAVIAGLFLVLSDVRLLSAPSAPVGAIERPAGEVAAPDEGAQAGLGGAGDSAQSAAEPAAAPTPQAVAAPQSPETAQLSPDTTESLGRPETPDTASALQAPAGSEGGAAPIAPQTPAGSEAAAKASEGPLPSAPAADTPLDVPQSAEAPAQPAPVRSAEALAPPADPAPGTVADAPQAPSEGGAGPVAVQAPEALAPATANTGTDAPPDTGTLAQAPDSGASPALPDTGEDTAPAADRLALLDRPEPAAMPGRPAAPLGGADSPRQPAAPQAPEAPGDVADSPIRVPVEGMANLAPQVRTNRLPTIGGAPQAEPEAEEETTEPAAVLAPAEGLPALQAFAEPFEDDPTLPRMAVVLIDDGSGAVDPAAFAGFPVPLAFAVDATRPDAAAAAYDYRAAGFEVVLLTEFPQGVEPSEVEIAMEAFRQRVPEAVALFETGAQGASGDRAILQQLVAIARANGQGMLSTPRGLNAAQQIAERQGVPAALVFRTFDADGQSIPTMKRYLNRAAFKAAQEGHVVMVGHTRADTIKALVEWVLDDRSSGVALAPVSAVLSGL
ncbi:divergent polysaccharide deacteylase family protein [Pseudoruegeria sp. SHC-113]|uniref:divergent polysaccharide deacteylase family protein n=1 Tax=Pseudoruegeria sp. SHC-113 TaxID=2855439 RepID=UPI0021BACC82|nr:divergent polysaccharide deacteylase family protein [Pseudoruegeria sp. SHC-113]MCT8160792.1 divergent polysaccharide deacetylase family protein [Pseudoruegeria sp. SHC-113]